MSTKLNKRQQIAVQMLAVGYRPIDVADHLDVSKETVSRWSATDSFDEELERLNIEFLEGLTNERYRLFEMCHEAIKDLLSSDETSQAIKANVALKYLSISNSNKNIYDLIISRWSMCKVSADKRELGAFRENMSGFTLATTGIKQTVNHKDITGP